MEGKWEKKTQKIKNLPGRPFKGKEPIFFFFFKSPSLLLHDKSVLWVLLETIVSVSQLKFRSRKAVMA